MKFSILFGRCELTRQICFQYDNLVMNWMDWIQIHDQFSVFFEDRMADYPTGTRSPDKQGLTHLICPHSLAILQTRRKQLPPLPPRKFSLFFSEYGVYRNLGYYNRVRLTDSF